MQPGKIQSFENSSLIYWHRRGVAFAQVCRVGLLYCRLKITQQKTGRDQIAAGITLHLHYPFYLYVFSKADLVSFQPKPD